MKKIVILILVVSMIGAITVLVDVFSKVSPKSLCLEDNIEALSQAETGIGRICAYTPYMWCIYLDPYEEYEGIFVSDPIVP